MKEIILAVVTAIGIGGLVAIGIFFFLVWFALFGADFVDKWLV